MFREKVTTLEWRKIRIMELCQMMNELIADNSCKEALFGEIGTCAVGGSIGSHGYVVKGFQENGKYLIRIMNCGVSLHSGKPVNCVENVETIGFAKEQTWQVTMYKLKEQLKAQFGTLYQQAYTECHEAMKKLCYRIPWKIRVMCKLGIRWTPQIYRPKRYWMRTLISFNYKYLALRRNNYKVTCAHESDHYQLWYRRFCKVPSESEMGYFSIGEDIRLPMFRIFERVYGL